MRRQGCVATQYCGMLRMPKHAMAVLTNHSISLKRRSCQSYESTIRRGIQVECCLRLSRVSYIHKHVFVQIRTAERVSGYLT